jgi:hypothetical protein
MLLVSSIPLTDTLTNNVFLVRIQIGNNVYQVNRDNITMKEICKLALRATVRYCKDVVRGVAW